MLAPLYSVIIPTYNRGALLKKTIASVCSQSLAKEQYEIIVIDDESKDDTEEIVRSAMREFPHHAIIYRRIEHGGPSKARNDGIKIARGEILFFTDDDCVVPYDWMETLLGGYRRYPEAVGVGGWQIASPEILSKNSISRYIIFEKLNFESKKYVLINYDGELCNCSDMNKAGNTANMSYRRRVFDEIGYFDETLYFPGNVDLELRIRVLQKGYPIVYLASFVIHHKPTSLRVLARKWFMSGMGWHFIAEKNLYYPSFFTWNDFVKKLQFCFQSGGWSFMLFWTLNMALFSAGWYFEAARRFLVTRRGA